MHSEGLKAGGADVLGLLAFIARFLTAGLNKYPEANTRLETAEVIVSSISGPGRTVMLGPSPARSCHSKVS